jgi:hypothetical protein
MTNREEYDDPVDQIMFILGFKHDPKFGSILEAVARGSNPGILDAADQVQVWGAIEANLFAWAKTVKVIRDEVGAELSPKHKDEMYRIIVDELDEAHYGGRWFEGARAPSEGWVNMGTYSPLFARANEVFYLPVPYFQLLAPIL